MGLTIINNKKHLSVSLLDKINKGKNNMKAYHGKQEIKDFYLARVRAHREADEIIKGVYWENGKGCAVGCTIHSANHEDYEKKIGASRILARLEDCIFENLPNDKAKFWPEKFLEAIEVGADLSEVWPKFTIWLLTDEKYGVMRFAKTKEKKKSIQLVCDYYRYYKNIKKEQWRKAASAASSAVSSTYDYANAAAYAAAQAAYNYANANADFSAVSANAAYTYAAYGNVSVKENYIIAQSEKLLELLRECK